MNAVEIEEAVSELASQPFDRAEFPFQFLTAFGAKDTTLKRLRKGETNASDVGGGLLWRNYVHIAVTESGEVGASLAALRTSSKTTSQKAKFIVATDGDTVEAEDLVSGDTLACAFSELGQKFAFFLALAGISTVREIKNNPIDVKATGRLNRLYVELLKDNPDWATEAKRPELNQFMARLIFCFFAEDTGIFRHGAFTTTINQMSHAGHGSGEDRWGNTHEILKHLFQAMDTDTTHKGEPDDRYRRAAGIRPWADIFPYVNGGLFTGVTECPRFSRTARAYLLRAGELDWKEINPDIFGSMIQAVADDGERGELGLHYTSVPNILKVLNPLFLDDLREQLEAAGDSKQKLRNLRKRLANIRVFDPACGSGNFLVIAYKQMRAVEAEIVRRLGGEATLKLDQRRSFVPLSNFYGIEIKGFAAEIARLALLIAEFQADCLYLSQQEARAMVLPLHKTGQITVGNALRLDWVQVCPPVRQATDAASDLGGLMRRLAPESNGLNGGEYTETFICGNPPYKGSRVQEEAQKHDLRDLASTQIKKWKSLDYVSGWFLKASGYQREVASAYAFVSTSSICEGLSASILWSHISNSDSEIFFAHRPFKWANLASNNAGVTVVVVGVIAPAGTRTKVLYEGDTARIARNINCYLLNSDDIFVHTQPKPMSNLPTMVMGAMPRDGGHLLLDTYEKENLLADYPPMNDFVRKYAGSDELINGRSRYCLWIEETQAERAVCISPIAERLSRVAEMRIASTLDSTREFASRPYRFVYVAGTAKKSTVAIAAISSERRHYLPAGLLDNQTIASNKLFALYDAEVWTMSIIVSRLHVVWISTVCGRMRTDYSYSNTLGWNTFPVPRLTEQDKADLTRTAENILLAREAHFPATIADLYDPEVMPDDLRHAHDENDEVLERIYIGRRFRNDTERLEKLFDLYTQMTAAAPNAKRGKQAA